MCVRARARERVCGVCVCGVCVWVCVVCECVWVCVWCVSVCVCVCVCVVRACVCEREIYEDYCVNPEILDTINKGTLGRLHIKIRRC